MKTTIGIRFGICLFYLSLTGCDDIQQGTLKDYNGDLVCVLLPSPALSENLTMTLYVTDRSTTSDIDDCFTYDLKATVNGISIPLSEPGGVEKDYDGDGSKYCQMPYFMFSADIVDWHQDTVTIEIWDKSVSARAVYKVWNGETPHFEIAGSINNEVKLGSTVELVFVPPVKNMDQIMVDYGGLEVPLGVSTGGLTITDNGVSFVVHSNSEYIGITNLRVDVEPYWTPPPELMECVGFDTCFSLMPPNGDSISADERRLPFEAVTFALQSVTLVE